MIHLSQMVTHLEVMRIVWNLNEFDVHRVNVAAKTISEELIKIQAARKDQDLNTIQSVQDSILRKLNQKNLKFMEHEDQVRGGLLGIIIRFKRRQLRSGNISELGLSL